MWCWVCLCECVFLVTLLTKTLLSRLLGLLWLPVQKRVLVLPFQSAGCHCAPENCQRCFCRQPQHLLYRGVSLPSQLNSPQVDSNHLKATRLKKKDLTASESFVNGLCFGSVLKAFQALFILKIKTEKQRMLEITLLCWAMLEVIEM